MSKGASSKAALILMLIGACGVGALAWYVKAEPKAAHVPPDLRRDEPSGPDVKIVERVPVKEPEQTAPSRAEQTVMVPVFGEGKMADDMRETPVPDGEDPKAFVVNEIAKGSHVDAKVLGVDLHNGVAVVNFGNGIDDGMGSDQEALFISALQKAFGQFDGVQKLELDKEGQPLDSLGGHIDLTDGLPVSRPGSKPSDSKPPEP